MKKRLWRKETSSDIVNAREYLKLIRPYGILFIGCTPVFGALCNGQFDVVSLFLLLIIGLLGHIFVFVQNDYYDMEVDRQSKYVVQRPLISGVISKRKAGFLFLSAFFISVVLCVVFFFSIRSFVVLLLSFFLMTLYNRYSKRKPGMEYVLGAAVFSYGLFGAFTVSDEISLFAFVISCVGFLQWVFSVGISANLKDVEFDTKLGIRTTPVVLGVHVAENELIKPRFFIIYTFLVKSAHLLMAVVPFLLGFTSIFLYGYPIPLVGVLIIAFILFYTTRGILKAPLSNRKRMLQYEGLHEGLGLLLIPFVLLSYLIDHFGVLPTFFLMLLLIIWPLLCLRFLYGKNLIPLE
ncbi:MAG: UbiA prenyltransferase family protein [Candidatus Thermoplasmatota archaeon]|nr:UbiA prenyltransferase family protein [Candidatus Thermoplasmatota archaeon]